MLTVTVLGVFVLLYAGFGRSPLDYLESLRRSMSGQDFASAFQGIVSFDSVLVSAADRPAGLVEDTCLMVVVRLAEDAPATPLKQARSPDGRFEFGGRWRETQRRTFWKPAATSPTRSSSSICTTHWDSRATS